MYFTADSTTDLPPVMLTCDEVEKFTENALSNLIKSLSDK